MKELRKKSMLLTGYLELLLNQCISPAENFSSYHPEGNGKVLKQIGVPFSLHGVHYTDNHMQ